MNLTWLFPTVLFLFCLYGSPCAQQTFPPRQDGIDQYLPPMRVALAGEVSILTYGAALSFPVFWIDSRVKITPLIGFFWDDLTDDGSDINPAVGGKLLVYFRKQYVDRPSINSFYLGVGGMSSRLDLFGHAYKEDSSVDIIIGYDYALNLTFQIAPEIHLGVNRHDELRVAIGVVLHIGR